MQGSLPHRSSDPLWLRALPRSARLERRLAGAASRLARGWLGLSALGGLSFWGALALVLALDAPAALMTAPLVTLAPLLGAAALGALLAALPDGPFAPSPAPVPAPWGARPR
ncbi:hypothetical protein [Oceanicella actignis]|uniref:hypothetical protein n=1 Tax=Oceanicella actignis TaxID=1189325 RepID=UPI0011E63662|nr:hypothetical protein [Oceanicella actignis]TYO89460.1 hypothetical protein LY05_01448 [Oceanicella actignis]